MLVYKLTREGDWARDFRFRDQIRAAAVSVPSNIAEGEGSGTKPNEIRYLNIAIGSCSEVVTQLIIAHEVGYIPEAKAEEIIDQYEHCQAMMKNLIKSKRKT